MSESDTNTQTNKTKQVKHMSASIDWNNMDRGVSYALQMETPCTELQAFVRGDDTHIELPLDKEAFAKGRMEFTPKYTMSRFTRTQVYRGLSQVAKRAAAHMDGCSALPTKPGKEAALFVLTSKWQLAGGKNKGKQVILAMQGLAYARRADKAAAANASLAAAVASGTAYIADGVTTKDGEPRMFDTRAKAVKAWVRNNHPDGGSWWEDKANKGKWLAKGEDFVSLAPQ